MVVAYDIVALPSIISSFAHPAMLIGYDHVTLTRSRRLAPRKNEGGVEKGGRQVHALPRVHGSEDRPTGDRGTFVN